MNEVNYDESKIQPYILPDPLTCANGKKIKSAFEWMNFRRPELLNLFHREMYGEIPPAPESFVCEKLTERRDALGGTAIRREYRLHFRKAGKEHTALMLLYMPLSAEKKKVPVFLGLNFKGNPAQTTEKDVMDSDHHTETADQSRRWRFEKVVARGFASCTVCYHDLFPDNPDGWDKSVLAVLLSPWELKNAPEKYTAIGTWAWGLSRILDALETVQEIDASRAVVHGHSRLGKTALLAGANDPRFALVVSNCSGCCGAALSRRNIGETIPSITKAFPHWFVKRFASYGGNESALPFDQHEFLSLIAPRPLAIGSAAEDNWADQKGEFLSAVHAKTVYSLFGCEGLGTDVFPAAGERITGDAIAYHMRPGPHDQILEDWEHYLDFAERFLKNDR